jgi:hypothetical protein
VSRLRRADPGGTPGTGTGGSALLALSDAAREGAAVSWAIAGVMVGMIVVWSGIFLWALKVMLDRYLREIDGRVAKVEKEHRDYATKVERAHSELERDVLRLRAELPEKYVQREDWIRFGSVIDAKLDALREALSRLTERVYEQSRRAREGQA